jgi:hypothetical protein
MRRVSKGALVMGLLASCLFGGLAAAQDRPTDNMEVLREKVRADKKLVVAAALDLTDTEAKRFWPVYNAYQSDMIDHYDRVFKLIETYVGAYRTMTDETATKLLSDYLALETDHVTLLKSYVPRFQGVLPATKVALLYQVENKVRALVNYEFARGIPLVKTAGGTR